MKEETAAATEYTSAGATMVLMISVMLEWFNENSAGVVALCAILTTMITGIAAFARWRINKKRIEIYEQSVKDQKRRKDDVL